jgi:CheY-like chemotaxis protein
MVVGEAIRNAGTLNIPSDAEGFLRFVRGPLFWAARRVLGDDVAETLVDEIVSEVSSEHDASRTLPLEPVPRKRVEAAPTSAGGDKLEQTLPYGKREHRRRHDVALIDADRAVQKAVQTLLEPRRYRVFSVSDESRVVVLCQQLRVSAIIANLEPGGYSMVNTIRHELGANTPPIVLLGGSERLKRPRPNVTRVLPKVIDEALADAVDAVIEELESGHFGA